MKIYATSFWKKGSVWPRLRQAGLALLLLAIFSAAAQAQLTNIQYTTTSDGSGGVIITGFSASGSGPLNIPATINGLTVSSIGTQAFTLNTNVTSVTIPSGVTSIKQSAFFLSYITAVTIPSSVTSIGDAAFAECGLLATITVDGANSTYSSVNGVLFNKNQTALLVCPGSETAVFNIPNGVTSIGNYAFDYCTNLTGVVIPNGVTSIGNLSFNGCSGLTSLTIPTSVITIGTYAFYGCNNLTNIAIPASVNSIGANSFTNCSSLNAITVDFANSAYSSAAGVLFDKNQTALIQYPQGKTGSSYVIPAGVTSVGTYAFSNSLPTSVTIPNSVTNFGYLAFSGSKLTSVTIPNGITNLGTSAFYGCASLTSVTISNSVTNIGTSTFTGCKSLTSVTIPSSVTTIGNGAFSLCSSLVSSIFLGNAPTMGASVFSQAASGFTVYYLSGATGFASPTWKDSYGDSYPAASFASGTDFTTTTDGKGGLIITGYTGAGGAVFIPPTISGLTVTGIGANAFSNHTNLTSVVIPNGITTIPLNMCFGDYNLTSVTIPNSVTSIGVCAFINCFSLANVTIPNNVASIGDNAFSGCFGLSSVTIPTSVTSIGNYAFDSCTSLTAITVNSLNSTYSSLGGVLFNKNQTTLIQCPSGKAGSYTIPTGVMSIGDSAFRYCTQLTSLTIPSSVTSVGPSVFDHCTQLSSVTIPSSVTSVGQGAFVYCSGLTSEIFAGNAPTMGAQVFYSVASGFTVEFFKGATGFTSPMWTDSSGDSYPAVEITTPTFAQWATKYGVTGGPTGTPEHDGVANQIKYLADINPAQPMSATDKAALPALGMNTISGVECLTLTYRQSQTTSGLVVTPQVSSDLQNWGAPGAGSQTEQVGTDSATGDPMMQVQVPVSGPKLFVRLKLTGS